MITHPQGTKRDKMKNSKQKLSEQREQLLQELDELLQQLGWGYADLAREIDRQDCENPDDDIDKIKERVKKSLQESRRKSISVNTVGKYIACIKRSDEYKRLGVELPFITDNDDERKWLQTIREISQEFWSKS